MWNYIAFFFIFVSCIGMFGGALFIPIVLYDTFLKDYCHNFWEILGIFLIFIFVFIVSACLLYSSIVGIKMIILTLFGV